MTGGVHGIKLSRARCPRCDQSISGGRIVDRPGTWLMLRPHKVPGRHPGRPWCVRTGERCEAEIKQ